MSTIRISPSSHPRYAWEVVAPARLFGKRVRKRFTSRSAAESYKRTLKARLDSTTLAPLDRDIHLIAARYQTEFTPAQLEATLSEAVAQRHRANPPLAVLLRENLERQERAFERGAIVLSTVRDARVHTRGLVRDLGTVHAANLTTQDIEDYVAARLTKGDSPRSIRNYLTTLSSTLNRAVRAGTLPANPVPLVSLPTETQPVAIVHPGKLAKLLPAAALRSPDLILPWLMFGAFAGLRTSETERLTWEDVRLDEGQLYVSAGKTANAERWVELLPPLASWLRGLTDLASRSGPVMGGAVYSTQCRHKGWVFKEAGYTLPRNALRHSYGSHHLVEYGLPAKTATEMGHYSPQQTFAAYRRAVTKQQASDYWALRVRD